MGGVDSAVLQAEADRVRAVYRSRDSSGKRRLYHWALPDVRYAEYRCGVAWARAFEHCLNGCLAQAEILDVGCGDGKWLRLFVEFGANPKKLHGVDLLEDRIATARQRSPAEINFQCSSGCMLPMQAASMDVVVASAVFSSIPSSEIRARLGEEMARVTKPGGFVMVYDFVFAKPNNRDTLGISRREVQRLFPTLSIQRCDPVTLIPPVVRRLSPKFIWLAHLLECFVPPLCSHRLIVLRKPALQGSRTPDS